jgi:hypothetical protein
VRNDGRGMTNGRAMKTKIKFILLLVLIAAVLAAIVNYPQLIFKKDIVYHPRESVTISRLRSIHGIFLSFFDARVIHEETLDADMIKKLITRSGLDAADLHDGWGAEMKPSVESRAESVVIQVLSLGPNGHDDGGQVDDVVLTVKVKRGRILEAKIESSKTTLRLQ